MGTNYYVVAEPPCRECGRPFKKLHLGKSSHGKRFLLRQHDDLGIETLEDWLPHLIADGVQISNEYGAPVSLKRFLSYVACPPTGFNWRVPIDETNRPRGVRTAVEFPYDTCSAEFS